jgi:hypothetical protein
MFQALKDILHDIPSFDFLVFASVFASILSLADMNELIRLVILLVTAAGAVVKLTEQIGSSPKVMLILTLAKLKWKQLTKKKEVK